MSGQCHEKALFLQITEAFVYYVKSVHAGKTYPLTDLTGSGFNVNDLHKSTCTVHMPALTDSKQL